MKLQVVISQQEIAQLLAAHITRCVGTPVNYQDIQIITDSSEPDSWIRAELHKEVG